MFFSDGRRLDRRHLTLALSIVTYLFSLSALCHQDQADSDGVTCLSCHVEEPQWVPVKETISLSHFAETMYQNNQLPDGFSAFMKPAEPWFKTLQSSPLWHVWQNENCLHIALSGQESQCHGSLTSCTGNPVYFQPGPDPVELVQDNIQVFVVESKTLPLSGYPLAVLELPLAEGGDFVDGIIEEDLTWLKDFGTDAFFLARNSLASGVAAEALLQFYWKYQVSGILPYAMSMPEAWPVLYNIVWGGTYSAMKAVTILALSRSTGLHFQLSAYAINAGLGSTQLIYRHWREKKRKRDLALALTWNLIRTGAVQGAAIAAGAATAKAHELFTQPGALSGGITADLLLTWIKQSLRKGWQSATSPILTN